MGKVTDKIKSRQVNKSVIFFAILIGAFSFFGCSTEYRLSGMLKRALKQSETGKQHHVGFALLDPETGHMVFSQNAEKYFTPASNTKLFTFYAGLKMLPDSMPAIRYVEQHDSLIFWGTGDPSFLQTRLKGTHAATFLKAGNKQLFYAPGRYTGNFYGKGWMWDDYNDYYQAEINELPLMDNLVSIKNVSGQLRVSPKEFTDCFVKDSIAPDLNTKDTATRVFNVRRLFDQNRFHYPDMLIPGNYTQEVPYRLSLASTLTLLADTLHKPVGLIKMEMPENAKTIYGLKRDSVLKEMMVPSDNFIAEQLILVYGNQLGRELNTENTIAYILKTYLSELPDQPVWVDGSGLSRANLFTPRDITTLLNLIYKEVNNPEKLFSMLPAGGKTGTLKNAYPKTDRPFVFGKTGSFSNNYNQSGYVLTKKGKTYIFSFMNNNFVLPTATVRTEMGRIITKIHEKF